MITKNWTFVKNIKYGKAALDVGVINLEANQAGPAERVMIIESFNILLNQVAENHVH